MIRIKVIRSDKVIIFRKDLPVDTASNQPLDMSQYEFLFGTTRIPGEKQDTLRYGCNELEKANHIVVARNNKVSRSAIFRYDNLSVIVLLRSRLCIERRPFERGSNCQAVGCGRRGVPNTVTNVGRHWSVNHGGPRSMGKSEFVYEK